MRLLLLALVVVAVAQAATYVLVTGHAYGVASATSVVVDTRVWGNYTWPLFANVSWTWYVPDEWLFLRYFYAISSGWTPPGAKVLQDVTGTTPIGYLAGSAYYDSTNGYVVLTDARNSQLGYLFYNATNFPMPKHQCVYAYYETYTSSTSGEAMWFGLYDNTYSGTREDVVAGGYHWTWDERQQRMVFTKSTTDNGPPIVQTNVPSSYIANRAWHRHEVFLCTYGGKVYTYYQVDGGVYKIFTSVDVSPQPNALSQTGIIVFGGRTSGATASAHFVRNIKIVFFNITPPLSIDEVKGAVASLMTTTSNYVTWLLLSAPSANSGWLYGGAVSGVVNVMLPGGSASVSASAGVAVSYVLITSSLSGSLPLNCNVTLSASATAYVSIVLYNATWAYVYTRTVSGSSVALRVSTPSGLYVGGYVFVCAVYPSGVSITSVTASGVYTSAGAVGTHYTFTMETGNLLYLTLSLPNFYRYVAYSVNATSAPTAATYTLLYGGKNVVVSFDRIIFYSYTTPNITSVCPPMVYTFTVRFTNSTNYFACTSVSLPSGYSYGYAPVMYQNLLYPYYTVNVTLYDPANGGYVTSATLSFTTAEGTASVQSGAKIALWIKGTIRGNFCPTIDVARAGGSFVDYVPAPRDGGAVWNPSATPRAMPYLQVAPIGVSAYNMTVKDSSGTYSCTRLPAGRLYIAYPAGSWVVLNFTAYAPYSLWAMESYPASQVAPGVTAYFNAGTMWLNVTVPATSGPIAAAPLRFGAGYFYMGAPFADAVYSITPYSIRSKSTTTAVATITLNWPNGAISPKFSGVRLTAPFYYSPITAAVYIDNTLFFPIAAVAVNATYLAVSPTSQTYSVVSATAQDAVAPSYERGVTYMGLLTQYYTPGKWLWVNGSVYTALVAKQYVSSLVYYPSELYNTIAMLAFANTESGARYSTVAVLTPQVYAVISGTAVVVRKVVNVQWSPVQAQPAPPLPPLSLTFNAPPVGGIVLAIAVFAAAFGAVVRLSAAMVLAGAVAVVASVFLGSPELGAIGLGMVVLGIWNKWRQESP